MKTRLLALLMSVSFVMFVSCGDDGGGGSTSNFGTQTEANNAVTAMDGQGAIDMPLAAADEALSLAAGSAVKMFKGKENPIRKSSDEDFIYNSGTGWWTWQYSYIYSFFRGTISHQYRFTPRDADGTPTSSTDQMEYMYDYDFDADTSISQNGATTTMDLTWKYNADMDVTGIVAHHASTGNLHLNGESGFEYKYIIRTVYGGQSYTQKMIYTAEYDFNDIQLANGGNYPASGTIVFKVKRDFTPEVQDLPNFYVAGSITFDGDNTATLTVGGYSYTINLDNGTITPA